VSSLCRLTAQTVEATTRLLDTSGAGIPNVTVQVKNVDTTQVTQALSERGGQYNAPFLQPGNYSVIVEAPG